MALNVKPGDKVVTSPITFVASANCVQYCGGEVIFADIDRETYLLDIHEVRKLLEADIRREIKGIIPVDFAGHVVNMEEYRKLADEFNCWIIEDACHAPGGSFNNSKGEKVYAGSCIYADLAIFSFHPVKHIAAGEGGMITTNNKDLYDKLLILRTHGIQQNPALRIYDDSLWYYEMQELGYNYRLTDIQAALGNSQLKRANEGIERRREIAKIYKESLKGNQMIKDRNELSSEHHAYHLYVIKSPHRDALMAELLGKEIPVALHYPAAIHQQPGYAHLIPVSATLSATEKVVREILSLPLHPYLSTDAVDFVCESIRSFVP
jgi:dTDP-4-amino-4,6-dideoxygalactose transaminase